MDEEQGLEGVDEPPSLDQFDTTVRLKYSLKAHPELTTKESIAEYLSPFGPVDTDSIVFSMKTKVSKAKSKAKDAVPAAGGSAAPTHGTALVPFKNIGDAYASVSASTLSSSSHVNLKGMEITWVNNNEPLILGWLKKMGKLPTPGSSKPTSASPPASTTTSSATNHAHSSVASQTPPANSPFSSFVRSSIPVEGSLTDKFVGTIDL